MVKKVYTSTRTTSRIIGSGTKEITTHTEVDTDSWNPFNKTVGEDVVYKDSDGNVEKIDSWAEKD